ncbi:MAG: 16S rRNA (adenine1518-N6/adenine1519-N6)-dimethyltransferase [Parcubacteria group bacterium Gr01-1014_8]|nr:MAG: 16S rRNA (adenine1518-N6/adenine1519-N6)-dimethyltransferase [Parcubacteria group bacterium Gr01-1014_8]
MIRNIKRKGARLGQHFLKSSSVAAALADSAHIANNDTVLEIGPGTGALTGELLRRGARIVAVEKDEALAHILGTTFKNSLANGALTIVVDDIRNVTPESLQLSEGQYILAANIPYYITGEIIRQFLSAHSQPKTMALLIQKEVAERIAKSKKESILSLSVKVYGIPHLAKAVGRGNFSPPPSVDSAILAITDISRANFKHMSEEQFFRTVRAGFASKRKVLRANLAKISSAPRVEHAFSVCNLPFNVRAEDVPLQSWLELAKAIEHD